MVIVQLKYRQQKLDLTLHTVVFDDMINGVVVIMGMDVIDVLEWVRVMRNAVKFGELRERNLIA